MKLVDRSYWGATLTTQPGKNDMLNILGDAHLTHMDENIGLALIEGGLNDAARGSIKDVESGNPLIYGSEDAYIETYGSMEEARKTIAGSINYAVDRILEKSPACIICLCTVQTQYYTNNNGIGGKPETVDKVNDIMKAIATERGLVIADLAGCFKPTRALAPLYYSRYPLSF